MSNRHQERASKVVASFRAVLDPAARDAISKAEWQDLEILVREAIAEELHGVAEQLEDLAHKLRTGSDIPSLGL